MSLTAGYHLASKVCWLLNCCWSYSVTKSVNQSVRVRVRGALWRVVYRKSVRLGSMSLETHDQFCLQLNPCGHSPYATSSLTRGRVCLLCTGLAFVKCTYRTYSMLLEIFLLLQVLCKSRLCEAYLTYLTLQRQLSHFNGRKLDCRQV
jgi:hypothetical protein